MIGKKHFYNSQKSYFFTEGKTPAKKTPVKVSSPKVPTPKKTSPAPAKKASPEGVKTPAPATKRRSGSLSKSGGKVIFDGYLLYPVASFKKLDLKLMTFFEPGNFYMQIPKLHANINNGILVVI